LFASYYGVIVTLLLIFEAISDSELLFFLKNPKGSSDIYPYTKAFRNPLSVAKDKSILFSQAICSLFYITSKNLSIMIQIHERKSTIGYIIK